MALLTSLSRTVTTNALALSALMSASPKIQADFAPTILDDLCLQVTTLPIYNYVLQKINYVATKFNGCGLYNMSLRKKQNNPKKSPRSTGQPSSGSRAIGLPDDIKAKLSDLFVTIEREFESLYSENIARN